MACVHINGHRYYRRSRRVGGRVCTEHVGGGWLGRAAAELDSCDRQMRRLKRFGEHLDADFFVMDIAACLAVDDAMADLFTLLAGRCGAYRHRRQWRWHRGGKAMADRKVKESRAELGRFAHVSSLGSEARREELFMANALSVRSQIHLRGAELCHPNRA